MAPTDNLTSLEKRYQCYSYRYGYYTCQNRWYDWGRWVVLAGVIIFVLLIAFTCACTARRRRRRGAAPMYGTGWMAPAGKHNDQTQMNNYQPGYNQSYQPDYNNQGYNQGYNQGHNQDYSQQPVGGYNSPPAYGQQPQNTGTTFNPNDGYYGHQQTGVQPPQNSYQRDANYAPPAGPPPGK
ncbi:hypothetical protein QQS21_001569 [Conoideocrella luteorostrata]|uniref:Chitin synthesis regulation, Congo red resistance, RCR protein n=1 Tax=Conoideocrella luteorostrata TaxID=1105319 RepID=A0AAJ0G1U4_9HYPO|nr:hypothetical protein QQS21_001569 [Conoideocrella luteorostrata]